MRKHALLPPIRRVHLHETGCVAETMEDLFKEIQMSTPNKLPPIHPLPSPLQQSTQLPNPFSSRCVLPPLTISSFDHKVQRFQELQSVNCNVNMHGVRGGTLYDTRSVSKTTEKKKVLSPEESKIIAPDVQEGFPNKTYEFMKTIGGELKNKSSAVMSKMHSGSRHCSSLPKRKTVDKGFNKYQPKGAPDQTISPFLEIPSKRHNSNKIIHNSKSSCAMDYLQIISLPKTQWRKIKAIFPDFLPREVIFNNVVGFEGRDCVSRNDKKPKPFTGENAPDAMLKEWLKYFGYKPYLGD